MVTKRKRSALQSPDPTVSMGVQTPQDRQQFQPKSMPDGRSLLLELPAELRDIIYQMVLRDVGHTQLARSTSKPRMGVNTGLVRVNKQIHDEFNDMIILYAPDIGTTCRNLDFSHIIAFLNRLSDEEVKKLSSTKKTSAERHMQITMFFTSSSFSGWGTRAIPALQRWLNRLEDPAKRGTTINFEYCFKWEKLKSGSASFHSIEYLMHRFAVPKGPRGRDHLTRIRAALGMKN